MSVVLEQLRALLARFDDEAYVALANRGLVRRARKDLERHAVELLEEGGDAVLVAFDGQRVRLDARGPAHAQCSCPASGVCQHILAAAMALRQHAAQAPPTTPAVVVTAEADPIAPLHAALLAMTPAELTRHAGKASYRWAWQFVQDLDPHHALQISGTQHLVLQLQRPRLTLRYMGGGIDDLLADAEIPQLHKYRVAAVLAYQRAHGKELEVPEPAARPRSQTLDLGLDHALAEAPADAIDASRQRLRQAVLGILVQCVELGLAHLSADVQQRFATLAVWAQSAQYPRLALLLRRIADHVELLLDRAGGADEQRLLDELALTYGLTWALDAAAARGLAPAQWLGRSRGRYDAAAPLELLGLGAQAWRSPAGFVGLTMVFWSPAEQAFMSCTDARPDGRGRFDPKARYRAAGPWSGLGAPQQATGRKVVLVGAQRSDDGRLSAAQRTSATLMSVDAASFAAQLRPWTSWAELQAARSGARRSLLAEAMPVNDWAALRPATFGAACFDETRQTLVWPLLDEAGRTLVAELPFGEYTRHAISRIEALRPEATASGALLVARIRLADQGVVAEPLSLVLPPGTTTDCPVDTLHFDNPHPGEAIAGVLSSRNRGHDPALATATNAVPPQSGSRTLRELRHAMQRQAERGLAAGTASRLSAEVEQLVERCAQAGLPVLRNALHRADAAGERVLRLNYLCMQLDALSGTEQEAPLAV